MPSAACNITDNDHCFSFGPTLLGDIAVKVVQDNTKYKNFERSRLSKIVWGDLDITACLDDSLQEIEEQLLNSEKEKKECIKIFIKVTSY